jgi:endo-1,4-beta-mannosidase
MSDADRKDDHFYKQGYQREYLPRVEKMVTQLKDRPEIMIWELINEPETESFEAMHHFTTTVSQAIKAKAPNHLISLGTLGGVGDRFGSQLSRFSGENIRRLYAIPTLDAASIHNYAYDATVLERLDLYHRFKGDPQTGTYFGKADQVLSWGSRQVDELALKALGTQLYNPLTLRGAWENLNQQNVQAARELGKPLYVGEVGFKKFHGENRANLLRVDLARTMQAGAQGYLLWSYEAQNCSQDGHDYGFKDADQFAPVVQEWNRYFAQLAAHPEQAKTLKPPAGDNFSLRHQTGNYLEQTDKALGDWIPDLLYDWMK